jgi:hypothetical protein
LALSSRLQPLIGTALACILTALTLNPGSGSAATETRLSPAPVSESVPQASVHYVGLDGCSSGACHGRDDRAPGDSIWRNEYQTWASQDKHSKAFLLLYNESSQAMAERLGLGNPIEEDRCLACHSVNLTNQDEAFDISDGVLCEACHGPASGWGDSHFIEGHTREESLAAGMLDTKDLEVRTKLCISCHVGSPERNVDHELIAAGHPDLVFEIQAFSTRMPRHWRVDSEDWEGARLWIIGQVLTLRETLQQLYRRADPSHWYGLDFADLECSSCHHSLYRPSRRQENGYSGQPGLPTLDPSGYVVWLRVSSIVLRDETDSLGTEMEELRTALENFANEGDSVRERIERISITIDALALRFQNIQLDSQMVSDIIGAISDDAETIAEAGIRAAEQATLAVESLYASYRSSTGTSDSRMEAQIRRLHEARGEFNPRQFSEELQGVGRPLQPPGGDL